MGKGTGLGLVTVFGIVEQHKGWISVDSQPGTGTAIHLYFPRVGQSLPPVEPSIRPHEHRGNETIVVVEDELSLRNLLVTLLKRHSYQVYQAESGVAAPSIWSEIRQQADLLFTDMVLVAWGAENSACVCRPTSRASG